MSVIEQIFEAGIVGCGGAGFPTHAKLSGSGINHLILNGAECEPLLGTDRWLMRNRAQDIILAAQAVAKELGVKSCTLGLKKSYTREIAALSEAIEQQCAAVTLHTMESFYPAGDEQVLVYEITGRVVPPGGLPSAVGAVVCNVATMVAVSEAIKGLPFTHKYLTVTGAVAEPLILRVPVGTPLGDCIRVAGGATVESWICINGGPMMGSVMTMEQTMASMVTKTTSGLILLPADSAIANANNISLQHMKNRAAASCVQCSSCTELCPRHLLGHPLEPHKIMRRLAMGNELSELIHDPEVQNAALCCQCGVCESYACPMGLQPRRVNALVKEEMSKAGIRREAGEPREYIPLVERRHRKIPTGRAAARVGVTEYYHTVPERLAELHPSSVTLPLDRQIGAPCVPIVKAGEQVTLGQPVAQCPKGKLGANLHASIAGTVTRAEDCIVIEERRG